MGSDSAVCQPWLGWKKFTGQGLGKFQTSLGTGFQPMGLKWVGTEMKRAHRKRLSQDSGNKHRAVIISKGQMLGKESGFKDEMQKQ